MKNKKFKVYFNDGTYADVAFVKDGERFRLLNVKEGYLYEKSFKDVQHTERQLRYFFGNDNITKIESNKVFII